MMYLYCSKRSVDALELCKALNAQRLRRFDGIDFWDKKYRRVLVENDIVVCWGDSLPELDGIRVLNACDQPLGMYKEWTKLVYAGVPVTTVNTTTYKPGPLVPRVQRELQEIDKTYAIVRENFVNEYQIHSFSSRSIRAGVRTPRDGFVVCKEDQWRPNSNLAHPWIRSFEGGWQVKYGEFKSTSQLRSLAHKAVLTLGLTFGAVDIGLRPDGDLRVLSVDKSPRLDTGTLNAYVRAITRWTKREDDSRGVPVREPGEVAVGVYSDDIDVGDPGDL